MTAPFVADSSVAIGWIHPGQATTLTGRLLQDAKAGTTVHVPALWHLEVANALLAAVRRKLILENHRARGLALLRLLKLAVDHEATELAFLRLSELASKYSLSVYDACYLELAIRKSLPLGSRDEALRAAAIKSGVELL